MSTTRVSALLAGLLGVALAGGGTAALLASHAETARLAAGAERASYGNLANVPILQPDGDPRGLAVALSDRGGTGPADRALAEALRASGLAVLPVDTEQWLAALDGQAGPAGECLYLGSDLEGIAKEALRTLELDTYFHPVVVGRGIGGTLAYAAVADAPAATLAGGVALDAAPAAPSRLPVCEGAAATRQGEGFRYDDGATLPQPFTFVAASGAARAAPAETGGAPARAAIVPAADPQVRFDAAVEAAGTIADADTSALPTVLSRPAGTPVAAALFFSGDGGWRDLDKTIGDWLAAHGVEVIGVDALRYFWSEKTPAQMGADMNTMLADANLPPGVPVALLGYSFGADTLPFAYGHLAPEWQARTALIGLLAPGLETGFQISVGGWLGLATGDQGVVDAAATLPATRTLCIYGEDEGEASACLDPKLGNVTRLAIPGGHHFDGDYDAMAARIRAAILAGPAAALPAPPSASAAN